MVVNKYSYRMCAIIKTVCKDDLLEFLNEDHILHSILLCKDVFDKLYVRNIVKGMKRELTLIVINFIIAVQDYIHLC